MFPFGLIQNDKFTGLNVPNKKTETRRKQGTHAHILRKSYKVKIAGNMKTAEMPLTQYSKANQALHIKVIARE